MSTTKPWGGTHKNKKGNYVKKKEGEPRKSQTEEKRRGSSLPLKKV